jgi:hypothetical protein
MKLSQIITEDITSELKEVLHKLGYDVPTLILQQGINGKIVSIKSTPPTFLINMEKHPKMADDIRFDYYEFGDPGQLNLEITPLPGKMALAKVS